MKRPSLNGQVCTDRGGWVQGLECRLLLSASLVKDINTRTQDTGTAAGQTVDVNGTAFFTLDGQVWKSDGTASGTVPVSPFGLLVSPSNLTAVNGTLYFAANNPNGTELWRTDGTPASTRSVRDINPGPAFSSPRFLTNVGGTLYFVADTAAAGTELWRSDGTEEGTVLVRDLRPGTGGSDPRSLRAVGNTLFFVADDGTHGYELWRSDAAGTGATLVRDVYVGPGTSGPGSLTDVNGTLYFSANAGTGGYELWRSDGTDAGTQRVKDINPGPNGSSPCLFTNVNGTLYFSAYTPATGDELWRSDGTATGTVLVKDISPGALGSGLESMTAAGDRLFFRLHVPSTGTELWTSDGTEAGTTMVRDLSPGSPGSYPREMTAVRGTLYYSSNDGSRGYELWKSDGTSGGTTIVADLLPGAAGSSPSSLTAVGGLVFFNAYPDGAIPALFRTDGTAAGTVPLMQFDRRSYPLGSNPSGAVTYNGAVYFVADDGMNGTELWRTDGTAAGTTLFKDIVPGPGASSPSQLMVAGGLLYFTASGVIWRTDGTVSGTTVLSGVASGPHAIKPWGDGVVFLATDAVAGEELWRAGPTGGAVRLTDINPGPAGSRIASITPAGDSVYFVANDGSTGDELWKSNGAAGGATRVRDLVPGPGSGGPWFLTAVRDTLLFRATDGADGWELWRTDGTDAGTTLVKDISPGPANSDIGPIVEVNGTAFFTATDGIHGLELWRSDGTATGTTMVRDIHPGRYGSSPANLVALNGALYFRADDGVSGQELWRSDGTTGGTAMLLDLYPGAGMSVPYAFTVLSGTGRLAFRANDGIGYAVWYLTDGTAAGTGRVFPATPWVLPPEMAYLNGSIYFGADFGGVGAELWNAALNTSPAPAALAAGPERPSPAGGMAQPAARPGFAPAPLPRWAAGSIPTDQSDAIAVAPAGPAQGNLESPLPTLLDTFWYAGHPDLAAYGLVPAGLHYFFGLYPGEYPFPDQDTPDEATIRTFIRSYAPNYPVVIPDIEQWPLDVRLYSDGLVQVYLERFMQIVDWMHDEVPGTKVGFWSMLPIPDYWTPANQDPVKDGNWRAANDRLRPLAQKVDVIFPELYAAFDDRNGYKLFGVDNMREAARYGKPVSPFVWPQYFEYTPDIGMQAIPADYWRSILEIARGADNPITFWGGYGLWDDDAAWWAITRDFAASTVGSELPPPTRPAVVQAGALPGTPRRLTFSFNKSVFGSLALSDLTVQPMAGGTALVPSDMSYDGATQTVTFTLPADLVGGQYLATLAAADVADAGGTPMGSDATYAFTVDAPPVRVTVNDGSATRSVVRSVTVTFAEPVSLGAGAFSLVGRNGAGAGTLITTTNPSNDGRTYFVTFAGPPVVAGSLADGVYDLTVDAARVQRSADPTPALVANFTATFHRLYSDADGDGDSDNADLFQLRSVYGRISSDPAYRWYFDYDADGDVDNADLFQVRVRRGVEFKGY